MERFQEASFKSLENLNVFEIRDVFVTCGQLFQLCPAERPVMKHYVLVCKALAKRLYISLDFCYTFVLQKSSHVLCCGQTVRHFTIQFIRLSNIETFTEDISPSQQQPVKQHKRVQIFMIKWSAIEKNNCTGRFIRA